jgi:hypothetical protein
VARCRYLWSQLGGRRKAVDRLVFSWGIFFLECIFATWHYTRIYCTAHTRRIPRPMLELWRIRYVCYCMNRPPTSSGSHRPIWVVWGVAYIRGILIPVVSIGNGVGLTKKNMQAQVHVPAWCRTRPKATPELFRGASANFRKLSLCTSILVAVWKSWFCYLWIKTLSSVASLGAYTVARSIQYTHNYRGHMGAGGDGATDNDPLTLECNSLKI